MKWLKKFWHWINPPLSDFYDGSEWHTCCRCGQRYDAPFFPFRSKCPSTVHRDEVILRLQAELADKMPMKSYDTIFMSKDEWDDIVKPKQPVSGPNGQDEPEEQSE